MADYDSTDFYVRNRSCNCLRCASRSLMGPAVLITIGVLFLLDHLGILSFGRGIPILLIVIGLVQVAQRSIPATGHIQPAPYYPPGVLADQIRTDIRNRVEQDIARNVGMAPPTIPGNPPDSEVKRG